MNTSFILNLPSRIYRKLLSFFPETLASKIQDITHRWHYKMCLLCGRPYWGPLHASNQTWPKRKPYMSALIEHEIQNAKDASFKVLEIGSWAGASASIWAAACKHHKTGMVYCVDHWQASSNAPDIMKNATQNDEIYHLFLHNMKSSGLQDYIKPLRGSSDHMQESLKSETFPFIFVDGDHAYDQFSKDLKFYMRLVQKDGIICGDDLELLPDEIDIAHAQAHKNEDYILDPKTQKNYHPGVALGIREAFPDISMKNGFWAMRRTENAWIPVNLESIYHAS